MREDMVLKNPCWKVTRLPERNARDRVLSPEEWKRLIIELPQQAADIHEKGLSIRPIAKSLDMGRSTFQEYLERAERQD